MIKIISDHGFPKDDGSLPTDDAFDRFKNEREYVAQSGRMKTTVAAMDWAAAEIERLRSASAQCAPSTELLEEVLTTLRHAFVFITSRERMHIDGVALYQDTIEHVKAALTSTERAKETP